MQNYHQAIMLSAGMEYRGDFSACSDNSNINANIPSTHNVISSTYKTTTLNKYFEIRRNKLRWNGTLEELKTFVENELNEEGSTWKSPGGGTWISNGENLSVTWHSKSRTVYLNGERSEECNSYIHNVIKANTTEINPPNHAPLEGIDIVEDNMATNTLVVSDQNYEESNRYDNQNTPIKCDGCRKLSIEMMEAQMDVTLLWAKVNAFDQKSACHDCDSLKKENNSLRLEIKSLRNTLAQDNSRYNNNDMAQSQEHVESANVHPNLREQLNEYRQSHDEKFRKQKNIKPKLSETLPKTNTDKEISFKSLENKLDEVTNERDSLKTAIRILTKEHSLYTQCDNKYQHDRMPRPTKSKIAKSKSELCNDPSNPVSGQNKKWQDVKHKTKKIASTRRRLSSTNQGKSHQNMPLPVSNQYAVLDSNDNSDYEPKIDDKTNNKEETTKKSSNDHTLVMGDSMLKGLRQHSLSKATRSNVHVKCFPGAQIHHMKHYSIPPLSATKPNHVVLHIGTNDIHKKTSIDISRETEELCDHIRNTCSVSEITISSIITRNDDKDGLKVSEVNNL